MMKTVLEKIEVFGKLPLYAMMVLIIFAILYIVYDSNKANQEIIGNHLDHNTSALNGLANVISKNSEVLSANNEVLRSLQIQLKNNR